MPPITKRWCHEKLEGLGFTDISTASLHADGSRPYLDAYLSLRQAIKHHIVTRGYPQLAETSPPTGARGWQPSAITLDAFQQSGIDVSVWDSSYIQYGDDHGDAGSGAIGNDFTNTSRDADDRRIGEIEIAGEGLDSDEELEVIYE